MWTFKAWAEWRVPRNGADRQDRWVAGPHVAPGREAGWWGLVQTHQGEDQAGRPTRGTCRPALENVCQSGGECPDQSLAQGGRVGAWLAVPGA